MSIAVSRVGQSRNQINNMKLQNFKTSSVLLAGVLGCALFCQQAGAIPIVGHVDMNGQVTLDNTLGLANGATGFTLVSVVNTPDGAFTGTAGSGVTFNPFAWNPSSAPVTPLWKFTSAGSLYSFNLASLSVVGQSSSFLNLTGVGTLTISGGTYDPTPGNWSFTITSSTGGSAPNFEFGFVSSTSAVPDGGSTVALLGCALVALGGLRRKLAK